MSIAACPLCYRTTPIGMLRPLYGAPVCGRCRAGLATRRSFAFIIDWCLWHVLLVVAAVVLMLLAEALKPPKAVVEMLLLAGVYIVAPTMLFMKDGFRGCSPGKAVCGLRVVSTVTGRPAGFLSSLKRNLVLYVPLMPLVMAFLLMDGPRVGDGWARTRVILRKHAGHPVFTGLPAAHCTRCHYDLTGNTTGICSECGTPVVQPLAPAIAA